MEKNDRIRWAPRLSKERLHRLYRSDAAGMLDEELLEDVGYILLDRCQSILEVAEAKKGRVRCPTCHEVGRETVFERERGRQAMVICPVCGWQTTWLEYIKSYKRHQLNLGGAGPAFEAYVGDFPAARSPQEKMLAVDRLIHAFHYSLTDLPDLPTRPAGVNLINGKLEDVITFLNELTFGTGSTPGLGETRQEWQETLDTFRHIDWRKVMEERRQKSNQSDSNGI
jgi:hypothetical protein